MIAVYGVDEIFDCATFATEAGKYEKTFNLVGYPLAEGYPEKPMKKHLLQYFLDDMGLPSFNVPSIVIDAYAHIDNTPKEYATLHVKAGWSAYKNWPADKWAEVLKHFPDLTVYQIGTADEPKVSGANHDFMGTELMAAIHLISNSSLHMGVDSFTNHLTNITWLDDVGLRKVPAVILWGSTQATAAGYKHNKNISLGLECQPCFREDPAISRMSRGPCINPIGQVYDNPQHACMAGISVDAVVDAITMVRQPKA